MFIVLEGIDGSGTSTATLALAQALHQRTDRRIITTAEPTQGPIGAVARQVLQGVVTLPKPALLYLMLADRQWHLTHTIVPNLNDGAIVISDRYAYSTWCYQQFAHPRSLVEDLIARDRCAVPDLVCILDAPETVCLKRKEGPKELFERRDVLRAVRRRYQAIAQGEFRMGDERVFLIDALMPPADVVQSILTYVQLADETIPIDAARE